ncbi:frizzled-like [Panonychus citri]|uniref:frizzled-like n=1 Tax=Panonychus citri TaxID=50023 RepID=UPI002307A626|nr:frizzled-like [Panonychus citri]
MDLNYFLLCFLLTISSSFDVTIGVSVTSSSSLNPTLERPKVIANNNRRRCETITIASCKDIGYNETIFPNLRNHVSQQHAGFELHDLAPLIKINCSEDLKLLLCSVFFPPCTMLETPLPPCRSICLSSKNGCEHVVIAFGFVWPDYLDCNKFTNDEPCVSRTGNSFTSDTSININSQDPPLTGIHAYNYNPNNGDSINKNNRFACPVHLAAPKNSGYILRLNGKSYPDCATPCDGLLFNKNDKKIINGWIFICSIACLLSSLFTLFTHLLEPRRFGYPEKALQFISICYAVISLVHIVGFTFGDSISCNQPFPPPEDNPNVPMISTITQGTSKSFCTLTFMFLYFFGHSSYIWFTIMTLTWFIAFSCGWGREGFERITTWFHVFAWAVPCAEVFRVIALNRIEGDPLSGVCYHNFWNRGDHIQLTDSGLYLFYLSCSIVFLFIGFYYSIRLHQELKADRRDTYKMDNLLLRVSIFSIFYLISSFILIACNIYETTNLDSWMLDWQQNVCLRPDSGIPCPFTSSDKMPRKPNLWYFLLKYAARLVPGITLSIHLFSHKTLDSWHNFARKLCCLSEPVDPDNSLKI